ncbi:invasion associated locus B family protein [Roseibium sp. SCP14]|uniref:invasion associated locus B family protein n=1 Tax=Roseibium sp. SCP14 TaxID=3141375 RepID=UPI003335534A
MGRFKFSLARIAALAGIAFGTLVQGNLPALAQGEVRSTHGDWQMRCDTPPGASGEQCALIQNVTASDRENVGLSVIILKTADKQARILRVLAPLGVLLPSGLGLRVDNADIGRAGFVRCLPNGCIAEVILEEDLLSKLKAGAQATFIIFQTPEEGIGIPISLNGFSSGFDSLP